MKKVLFKSILIADLSKNTARLQQFTKGLNVITSSDNHVGKSSLLKSLYYAFGAEVNFDSVWDKSSKLYVSSFEIDDNEYKIARYMKRFAVFHDNELILLTDSIGKELSPFLAKIFDFSVYLPNKTTGKIEIAPPAFTFMPYYIDQDNGWNGLYQSFEYIQQYNKKDRIKSLYYHLNIYTKRTIELMAERDILNERSELLSKECVRISTILDALKEETSELPPAENNEILEKQLENSKKEIEEIVLQLGQTRNNIQHLEATIQQHQSHLDIIQKHKAYNSEMPNSMQTEVHTCQNCGFTFDDVLFNIVHEKYSTENESYLIQQIQLIIDSIVPRLTEAKTLYINLLDELHEKEVPFSVDKDKFDIYIRQRGLEKSIKRFTDNLESASNEIYNIANEMKKINRTLKKLPNKQEVEEKYIEFVRLNIMHLDAWDPAYDDNIKLLKPIKAQGTLENKIILAQVIGLFQTMDSFKSNATLFPFVVDSPRGNESSIVSSKDILKMITEISMLPQTILATIDFNSFKSELNTEANIITLKEHRKLLSESDFSSNNDYIKSLVSILARP